MALLGQIAGLPGLVPCSWRGQGGRGLEKVFLKQKSLNHHVVQ